MKLRAVLLLLVASAPQVPARGADVRRAVQSDQELVCERDQSCHSSLMQKLARVAPNHRSSADQPEHPTALLPTFHVDLDVAPEERWKDVILHYKRMGVIKAMTTWNASSPHMSREDEKAWVEAVRPSIDEEYLREIDGFVKYAGDENVTKDMVILSQFMYETNYPFFCSGLLAAMPNGTVIHGRNMDYGLFLEFNGKRWGWQEVTVNVIFMRGGKPLMTSVTWPFQLGIATAMRFDGWSYDQQTRHLGDDMRLNLAAAQRGSVSGVLLARRTMEQVPDFETAIKTLWSSDLIAPQYFIMAGAKPYEGAVLSMGRGGEHQPSSPPLLRLNATEKRWFLIQTNDDIGWPAKDVRRPVEEMKLSMVAQSEVSIDWVAGQMHSFPLDNPLTVYSWVAVPTTGFAETTLHSGTSANEQLANSLGVR